MKKALVSAILTLSLVACVKLGPLMVFDGGAAVVGNDIHLHVSNIGDMTAYDVWIEWSMGPCNKGKKDIGIWPPGRSDNVCIACDVVIKTDSLFAGKFHYR